MSRSAAKTKPDRIELVSESSHGSLERVRKDTGNWRNGVFEAEVRDAVRAVSFS